MKLSAKPISSPGRAEKYPPPLMRFMRTNVGSRSRGRLRSSPMFVRKKNNAAASSAVETTQEPSSPKVTCMGQVRVRRSSSKQGGSRPGKRAPTARRRRRCKWIRNAMFCRGKIGPKSFGPVWRKWVPFFQVGFCGKRETKNEKSEKSEKSQVEEPKFRAENGVSDIEDDEEDEEYQRKARAFVSSSTTPPKNALLLTRCRSAPFRSSSLASRFWGSPVGVEETDGELATEAQTQAHFTPTEKPTSETESISDPESRFHPTSEEKIEFIKELESSLQLKMAKSADGDDEIGGSSRPLILTRCKSEPARTAAEKLDPELCFWKIRRLGIVDSCSLDV